MRISKHIIVTSKMIISFYSRSGRDWKKEYALTWGGLPDHEMDKEKSAEAIVATGNEPRIETVEDSQRSEGLNIRRSIEFNSYS